MSEYYEGPGAGPGYIESSLQQADLNCIVCRTKIPAKLIVNTKFCPGGIDYVSNFMVKNAVAPVCDSCFEKSGIKLGPLPKVKDK